jgi:hypothetical protein
MSNAAPASERVDEIISLLRPLRPKSRPESFTAAVIAGDLHHMQLFLDRHANIEERSIGFASPLAAACSAGQTEAARWLIAHGANLNPAGALMGPMNAACSKGNCEMIAVLLDAGLPIEHAAAGVMAAATLGNLPMLRWLVGRGVELDRTYERIGLLREKALRDAERNRKTEIVAALRGDQQKLGPAPTQPPVPPSRPERPRAEEARRTTLTNEAVWLIRDAGRASARWISKLPGAYGGELLLSQAAFHGVTEIVLEILNTGGSPDAATEGTPPPLYRAAEAAEPDVLSRLLERGASPNGLDRKSWLPLLGAVRSGEPEIVKTLLAAGASPKAKPAGGGTLAQNARGPYADEIRILIESAPNPRRIT